MNNVKSFAIDDVRERVLYLDNLSQVLKIRVSN
jgi:hypothetical protein